jgi:hypothetical protein
VVVSDVCDDSITHPGSSQPPRQEEFGWQRASGTRVGEVMAANHATTRANNQKPAKGWEMRSNAPIRRKP